MPAALEIRPALPRTAVGKLSKIELRQEERDKAGREAEGRRGVACNLPASILRCPA